MSTRSSISCHEIPTDGQINLSVCVSLSGARGRRGKKGQQGYFVPQAPIIVNANMGHTCKCQGRGDKERNKFKCEGGEGGIIVNTKEG